MSQELTVLLHLAVESGIYGILECQRGLVWELVDCKDWIGSRSYGMRLGDLVNEKISYKTVRRQCVKPAVDCQTSASRATNLEQLLIGHTRSTWSSHTRGPEWFGRNLLFPDEILFLAVHPAGRGIIFELFFGKKNNKHSQLGVLRSVSLMLGPMPNSQRHKLPEVVQDFWYCKALTRIWVNLDEFSLLSVIPCVIPWMRTDEGCMKAYWKLDEGCMKAY